MKREHIYKILEVNILSKNITYNIKYCVGLLFLLCSTLAVGQRQRNQNDWVNDGLHGKVKSIVIKEYFITNDTAQQGELLEYAVKNYNERGYLTEIKEFNGDGTMSQRQVFVYSKKKQEELLYDEEGNLKEKTLTKLNIMEKPTQSIVVDARGKLQGKTTYQYDEKDRLIKQCGYNAKGKLSEKHYATYEKDVLCQLLTFSEFANKKILYKFDIHRNPIEMMVYDSRTKVFLEKITQKFDENKNLIEKKSWDEKNTLKSSDCYKYDEKGNVLEQLLFDADMDFHGIYFYVYQYDRNNNWTSQTLYEGAEKQAEIRIERIIEYYE